MRDNQHTPRHRSLASTSSFPIRRRAHGHNERRALQTAPAGLVRRAYLPAFRVGRGHVAVVGLHGGARGPPGTGRGRQGACGLDARVRVVLRRHLRERELGFGGHCGGRKIPSVGLGPRGLTPPTSPGLLRRWRCVPMRARAMGTAGCLPQRGTGGRSRWWRARGPQKRRSWWPRVQLGPHLDLESQHFATATARR